VNAYAVGTKDIREFVEPIAGYEGWPNGPSYSYQPIAPVLAETPAQAKKFFLDKFASDDNSGVYDDDWCSLRVRLIGKNVYLLPGVTPGVHEEADSLWAAMPLGMLG